MQEYLEAKELTETDLKFFEWHFHNPTSWGASAGSGKQKAINPGKQPLEHHFPAIASPAGWPKGNWTAPLAWPSGKPNFSLLTTLYGPGPARPQVSERSLSLEQKNWRINGLQLNPPDSPTRYDVLRPGDWVVMSIRGDIVPSDASLVFLRRAPGSDDAKLIAFLEAAGAQTGKVLPPATLEDIIQHAAPDPSHGIHALRESVATAVALSGAPPPPMGKKLIDTPVYRGRLTARDIKRATAQQAATGDFGEKCVNAYLAKQVTQRALVNYEWHSQAIADAPFDFVLDPNGESQRVDVKATVDAFNSPFYISVNELKAMLEKPPYFVYRIFEADAVSKTAKLKISSDLTAFAKVAAKALKHLPPGVDVTNLRVEPNALPGVEWSRAVTVTLS